MRSGIVGGTAAMVDGMLARIEEELGTPVKLIVTGGISELLVPQIRPRAGAPSQPAGTGIVQSLQAQHPFGTVKMNLF